MMIRDMFADDINRKINGVIKVDQAADDVIEQELNEYVITRELKKHFITFFNYYGDAFDQPTADMGVWISGFFFRIRFWITSSTEEEDKLNLVLKRA